MEYRQGSDVFALPPTPASTKSCLYRADAEDDSQVSSRKSLVEDPYYRDNNLAENNIYMRSFYEEILVDIAGLVDHVRKDRDSPGVSPDQIGTGEPDVEGYFYAHVFPDPEPTDILQRTDRNSMAKHAVPDFGSKLKVSIPVPDILLGYNRNGAFSQQQPQLRAMVNEMVANTQGLVYPFFVIDMWVATNQCLGGSASCVNIAERLNRQLRQCQNNKIRPVDSAAFSIAMNGTEARLYVSWKHDELKYYTRKVDSFLLQKPKDYTEFRKHVLNIIGAPERDSKIIGQPPRRE
ncbi:hypothetical protein BKA65DRAFT_529115 [Rhexocercosporidium sp. MPI-PUGE-AT-0058]|nr:hypothetical protein BKA65DRAFT_529115 [Rhexocercosporidium sp. MPI-PUGE-AT-0058]